MDFSEEIVGIYQSGQPFGRLRMVRKRDYKSTIDIIKELANNNSAVQEVIAKANEAAMVSRERRE